MSGSQQSDFLSVRNTNKLDQNNISSTQTLHKTSTKNRHRGELLIPVCYKQMVENEAGEFRPWSPPLHSEDDEDEDEALMKL